MSAKLAGWTLLAAALAGAIYVGARLMRFEISHGGSDRYYVVMKLDRWTGKTWKLESGGVWNEVR